MRFTLCVVILTVCIVALQCTANATSSLDSNEQHTLEGSAAVVTATTTTVDPGTFSTPPEKDKTGQGDEKDSSGHQEQVARDEGGRNQPEEPRDTDGIRQNQPQPPTEPEPNPVSELKPKPGEETHNSLNSQQDGAPTPNTTTTANKEQLREVPDTATDDVHRSLPGKPGSSEASSGAHNSATPIQHSAASTSQLPSGANTDTTTTTTALSTAQEDSGPTQTTTSTITSTMSQSILQTTISRKRSNIPQSVHNKDSSSSASLLFAFAALGTLSVMVVSLVYYSP